MDATEYIPIVGMNEASNTDSIRYIARQSSIVWLLLVESGHSVHTEYRSITI